MSPAKSKRSERDAPDLGKAGESIEVAAPRPKPKHDAKQSLHPIAAARLTNRRRGR